MKRLMLSIGFFIATNVQNDGLTFNECMLDCSILRSFRAHLRCAQGRNCQGWLQKVLHCGIQGAVLRSNDEDNRWVTKKSRPRMVGTGPFNLTQAVERGYYIVGVGTIFGAAFFGNTASLQAFATRNFTTVFAGI